MVKLGIAGACGKMGRRIFELAGFEVSRQKGDHISMTKLELVDH